jgi:radical SAM protein with 4Fe4S-binding SPASM domain
MDLIIKPTEACNFSCTFCSSSYLVEQKKDKLPLQMIYDFLKRFPETNTIIVNGGDPLMMPPQYYKDLIAHLDEHDYPADISFTTNLWAFYKNPEKWTPILKEKRINTVTSFHYGENRRIDPGTNYNEEKFMQVMDLFKEKIGHYPDFISVIDEHNYDRAMNNVYLAKHLDVNCKMNYANGSGRQNKAFLVSHMYKTYMQVWREGLAAYEWNTKQFVHSLFNEPRICPRSRECDEGIRVLQPDGRYFSCGAFGDEKEYDVDFDAEMKGDTIATPLQDDPELSSLKSECYSCKMFDLCNGCRKHIKEIKDQDEVELHCGKMKKLEAKMDQMKEEIIETKGYMNEFSETAIDLQD